MQLTFPNGESDNVPLDRGEVTVGSRSSNTVSLPGSGLSPHHASFEVDRRGLWLKVPADVPGVHVNARPVRSLALLRPGDLVCLDKLAVVVLANDAAVIDTEIPAVAPPAMSEPQRVAASRVLLRGASGPFYGRSYTLSEPRIIGRGSSADVRLDAPAIAERHAALELHGERIILRALTPGAVTVVNGIALNDAVLAPGDQLLIDSSRFIIEAPGLPPRGQRPGMIPREATHTQTMQKVRASAPTPEAPVEVAPIPVKDPGALWWLIAAAAVLAASVTALVVYAPKLG